MKFYVTRYALTSGIEFVEGVPHGASMIEVKGDRPGSTQHYHGNDFHASWENAEAFAEVMRDRAIRSAEKKILRLENMTFKRPVEAP